MAQKFVNKQNYLIFNVCKYYFVVNYNIYLFFELIIINEKCNNMM